MFMDNTAFHVTRTTTDKLEQVLNYLRGKDQLEPVEAVLQVTHVGGRDWVIICGLYNEK